MSSPAGRTSVMNALLTKTSGGPNRFAASTTQSQLSGSATSATTAVAVPSAATAVAATCSSAG